MQRAMQVRLQQGQHMVDSISVKWIVAKKQGFRTAEQTISLLDTRPLTLWT